MAPFYMVGYLVQNLSRFFLQAGTYTWIDLFLPLLGPGLILFYTFYLLWAGRRKNHKIIEVHRKLLLDVFSDEFDDLIVDQLSSNGGLLFPRYKKSHSAPFKNFRVVFALEERHLMLSVIISKFSGTKDYIAFEADARKGKLPTKIQIVPRHEEGQIRKHQDLLFSLDPITLEVPRIDEFFVIKATSQKSGLYFLGEKDLLKLIYNNREYMVRLSIDSADDPAIRIYARITEDLELKRLYDLFMTLCGRVNSVSEKMAIRKGRQ